jgi:hypothetical protein
MSTKRLNEILPNVLDNIKTRNENYMKKNWKITTNTDSIDIAAKSIGLNVDRDSWPRDVAEYLHRDRGLHIQIRHNKDPQIFAQANAVAALIAAAPEMLDACEMALEYMQQVVRLDPNKSAAKNQIKWLESAIRKARGEK